MQKRKLARAVVHPRPTPLVIEFLLDETGSMSSIASATIGGFNDFLEEQRQPDGAAVLTLTKFHSEGVRTPYVDLDIHRVPSMTQLMFNPAACTNLRDAILMRIEDLASRLTLWDTKPRVLFVVMTDGADNASRSEPLAVRRAVETATEAGWNFVFLGADQNATEVGSGLGFPAGNCRSFDSGRVRETMVAVSHATTAFRSSGAAASTTFFAQ